MYQHLLVPLDASPLAAVLTERAVAYAKTTAQVTPHPAQFTLPLR